MKSKWILFIGIILLVTGIVLRVFTDLGYEPILFIIVGVSFKTYYVIDKASVGEYIPGYELVFLFIGLLMFLSGIYLRSTELNLFSSFLVVCGLMLKVVFVIMFIINIRNLRKN